MSIAPASCGYCDRICSGQRQHLEIASYRGLILGAKLMNQSEIVELLRQKLQQEEQTAQSFEQYLPQLLQQAMSAEVGGCWLSLHLSNWTG